ncbi:8927_t:CDS:2 [Ambispora leptoticha]|uniref:8927_t:CDS:1 n=1 Tax=Ambispora leptoticha TaxID=144679 RepID=A0A9N9CQ39_9GLOM|nr:8927_t:CDS:2 [Ambispora leptoticha]
MMIDLDQHPLENDFPWEHGIDVYNTHENRLRLEERPCMCNPSPLGEAAGMAEITHDHKTTQSKPIPTDQAQNT